MPVIGLAITNISANKTDAISGGLKVDNKANITDVKEKDLPNIGKKGLIISFDYKTDYKSSKTGKSIAQIVMGGEVYAIEQKPTEIIELWKKSKKLSDPLNVQVVNSILRKCITKAILLSEELMLPSPIALPHASAKKPAEERRYIG